MLRERIRHVDTSDVAIEQRRLTTLDATGTGSTLTATRVGGGRTVYSRVRERPKVFRLAFSAVLAGIVASLLGRTVPASAHAAPISDPPFTDVAVTEPPQERRVTPAPEVDEKPAAPPAPSRPAPLHVQPVATEPDAQPAAVPPCERVPNATGVITLNTTPWTKVYLDGKLLGETPIANAKVPAGCLEIELVGKQGKRWVRTLRVGPGQRVRYAVTLE